MRIQSTCEKLKIPCAITVSEADRKSSFSRKAIEPALIDGYSAKDSYLNIPSIIKAAKKHKCNAIHPGYGFLSENAEFAKAIIKAGLIFIGPKPECIKALGDKAKARKAATQSSVPVTPGTGPAHTDKELLKEARKIGYPLLIKAVAGGGGRGMRVVASDDELSTALPLARSEAKKNFLDARVYLEKYIEKPRHVEVQIAGDNFGNVLHFGTRDCSTQRRHQKLIEEAPAPFLSGRLRESLHKAAIKIAKSVNYNSVGTAEFLVAKENFYFLEMNTRIQVEHPVTEEITGFDLIKLQIEIAEGKEFGFTQKDIKFKGHSIEFRINAEEAKENFRPLTGTLSKVQIPENKNLRVESGFESGDEITPYYDGLISKLIINGKNRDEAIKNSEELLSKTKFDGLQTTLSFHKWALKQKIFRESTFDIAFIGREFRKENLLEEEALILLDERHRSQMKGKDFIEFLDYRSDKFKHDYRIEVLHLSDSTFLFIPLNAKSKRAKEAYCRRSNSFDAAFNSLKSEVLETEKPSKIF